MQDADLETRLKSVLTNIQQAMSQRELPSDAFYKLVQNQLDSHQINYQEKDCREFFKFSIDIMYDIIEKLNIKKLGGLKEDYQLLPTTTLSEEARQDIQEQKNLTVLIGPYLTELHNKGRFKYEEDLKEEIQKYLEEKAPQLDSFRSLMLASEFTDRFNYTFNLPKSPYEAEQYYS